MIRQTIKTFKFVKNFRAYKKADSEVEQIKAAKLISSFIKKEGGIFLKMAQYMGTNKDHHTEIQKLSHLDDIGIDKEKAFKLLKKESPKFSKEIKVLDKQIATASIGQVHKVKFNEVDYAVKIQYPSIGRELQSQLKLLNLLPTGKLEKKWGIDIDQYRQMIKRLIDDELDYSKEANKQIEIKSLMGESPYFYIPNVLKEYSGQKVIISEYLDGFNANNLSGFNESQLKSLGESLVFTYISLLKNQVTQADSNHGNFIFLKKDPIQIGLIDFGQFYKFNPEFTISFFSLLSKIVDESPVDYTAYYEALGFSCEHLAKIENYLPLLTDIIFKPFLTNNRFDLDSWNYKQDLDNLLEDKKWWFRSAGGEEFFIVMKSFLGIKNLLQKNQIRINWQQVFKEVIAKDKSIYDSFAPKKIENKILKKKQVLVQIKNKEVIIMEQTFHFSCLLNLADFLPREVLEYLKESNLNLEGIVQKSIQDGMIPGELISIELEKTYSISIVE